MLGTDVCEFGGQFLELLWLTVCYRGEKFFVIFYFYLKIVFYLHSWCCFGTLRVLNRYLILINA